MKCKTSQHRLYAVTFSGQNLLLYHQHAINNLVETQTGSPPFTPQERSIHPVIVKLYLSVAKKSICDRLTVTTSMRVRHTKNRDSLVFFDKPVEIRLDNSLGTFVKPGIRRDHRVRTAYGAPEYLKPNLEY